MGQRKDRSLQDVGEHGSEERMPGTRGLRCAHRAGRSEEALERAGRRRLGQDPSELGSVVWSCHPSCPFLPTASGLWEQHEEASVGRPGPLTSAL